MEFSGDGVDESIQKRFLRIIGIDGVRVFHESDTGRKLWVIKCRCRSRDRLGMGKVNRHLKHAFRHLANPFDEAASPGEDDP